MPDQDPNPTTTRPLAVSVPAARPNYAVGSDTYSFVLTGKETAGTYAFIDMHVPPGGGPMPHAHEFEEMFYVVEGAVEVFCHDARATAAAGAAVNVPGWAPHVFKNLSPVVPARLLCVVVKAGLEDEFAEIGDAGGDPDHAAPARRCGEAGGVGEGDAGRRRPVPRPGAAPRHVRPPDDDGRTGGRESGRRGIAGPARPAVFRITRGTRVGRPPRATRNTEHLVTA